MDKQPFVIGIAENVEIAGVHLDGRSKKVNIHIVFLTEKVAAEVENYYVPDNDNVNVRKMVEIEIKNDLTEAFSNIVACCVVIASHENVDVVAQRVIRGRDRDRAADWRFIEDADLTKDRSLTAKQAVGPSIRHLGAVLGPCPSYRILGSASGSNDSHEKILILDQIRRETAVRNVFLARTGTPACTLEGQVLRSTQVRGIFNGDKVGPLVWQLESNYQCRCISIDWFILSNRY